MSYGIAGDTEDAGGGINLVDAESIAQRARGKLSGSGLFTGIDGGKGELAAGANRKHAADHSLLTHAQADHGMRVAVLLHELHHHHVVVERVGGGDDLDEVGRVLLHPGKRFFELLGPAIVVIGKDQIRGAAQAVEIAAFELGSSFNLDVNEMTAQISRLNQHIDLGGYGTPEPASIYSPPTGGHDKSFGVELDKGLQLGEPQGRLGQII